MRAAHTTLVATAPPPPGAVTTFGQTEWSPSESVRFFSALARGCLLSQHYTDYVLGLDAHIEPSESWGLGSRAGLGSGIQGRMGDRKERNTSSGSLESSMRAPTSAGRFLCCVSALGVGILRRRHRDAGRERAMAQAGVDTECARDQPVAAHSELPGAQPLSVPLGDRGYEGR